MQNLIKKKSIVTFLVVALIPIAFGIKMYEAQEQTKPFSLSQTVIEDSNVHLRLFSKFMENIQLEKQYAGRSLVSQKISKDPFRMPRSRKIFAVTKSGKNINRPVLSLKGILWDGKKSSAVINNKIFTKGSKIGQYTISKITREKVFLASSTDYYALQLSRNIK